MRGQKLIAWRLPALVAGLAPGATIHSPAGSTVGWAQTRLLEAARMALASIANDIRLGLQETVGVDAEWVEGDIASVAITLPAGTDTAYIARAIDLENVEAWCDEQGRVRVAIGPWYSTKDIDQVVLAVTKVTHVLLGLHAGAAKQR